jgi:hemolysin III
MELLSTGKFSPQMEKSPDILVSDEWLNSLTHGLGLLLSIVGLGFLLKAGWSESLKMICFGIYGSSLILLYAASTIYHALSKPKLKKLFRTIDHCAIYLLIAGSYTPFTVLVLNGSSGWMLFGAVWALACMGILFKAFCGHRFHMLSTAVYLLMGWLIVFAIEPFMNLFPYEGIYWVIGGGLSYTFGVIFYVMDKRRFYHAIWHLFVMGGSVCHYLAIYLYI